MDGEKGVRVRPTGRGRPAGSLGTRGLVENDGQRSDMWQTLNTTLFLLPSWDLLKYTSLLLIEAHGVLLVEILRANLWLCFSEKPNGSRIQQLFERRSRGIRRPGKGFNCRRLG